MVHSIGARAAAGALLVGLFAGLAHGCSDITAHPIQQATGSGAPGKIGDVCVPPAEGDPSFPGYPIGIADALAVGSDTCETGVCLVNHFQGRVTCPRGQPDPVPCEGPGDVTTCGSGTCIEASLAPWLCDPTSADGGASRCAGRGTCDPDRWTCACAADADCPDGAHCDAATKECRRHVCKPSGACQRADATDAENAGKICCAPGTDEPVTSAVCGQCDAPSRRDADAAVYCSCRCAPLDGEPPDGSDYCDCPDGFECAQPVNGKAGPGSPSRRGKYCMKQGTAQDPYATMCGAVHGEVNALCAGVPAP